MAGLRSNYSENLGMEIDVMVTEDMRLDSMSQPDYDALRSLKLAEC